MYLQTTDPAEAVGGGGHTDPITPIGVATVGGDVDEPRAIGQAARGVRNPSSPHEGEYPITDTRVSCLRAGFHSEQLEQKGQKEIVTF